MGFKGFEFAGEFVPFKDDSKGLKNLAKAVVLFEEAMLFSPDSGQYAYTYVLAIDGTGQSTQALSQLKLLIVNYPDKAQLRELGLYLSQKLNNKADYDWFMQF